MKRISGIIATVSVLALVVCAAVFLAGCDNLTKTSTPTSPTSQTEVSITFFDEPAAGEWSIIKELRIKKGDRIGKEMLPKLERPGGKKFGGWFLDKEHTNPIDLNSPRIESVVLYAYWEDNGLGSNIKLNKELFHELTETIRVKDDKAPEEEAAEGEEAPYPRPVAGRLKDFGTGVFLYMDKADPSLNGRVPNGNISFNFTEKFASATEDPKATWEIWQNPECNKRPDITNRGGNYITNLENGDNVFYLKVTAEDVIVSKVYKIKIVLNPQYAVKVYLRAGDRNHFETFGPVNAGETVSLKRDADVGLGGTDGLRFMELNPGYRFTNWQYLSVYDRNEYGDVIDADSNVLVEEDGVFYYLDAAHEKYPVLRYVEVDEKGKTTEYLTEREGDKYYKFDKVKKARVKDKDGHDVEVDRADCFNVLDEKGFPEYYTSPALKPRVVLCNWEFDKTKIFGNVTITGQWEPHEYTITLDLNDGLPGNSDDYGGRLRYQVGDEVKGAVYDGSLQTKVKFGIEKTALAQSINALGSNRPTHAYAQFRGWYFHPEGKKPICIVDEFGVGQSGWNTADLSKTDTPVLKARWEIKKFKIAMVCDETHGSAKAVIPAPQGAGEEPAWTTTDQIEYGGTVKFVAEPKEGWEFEKWTIDGRAADPDGNPYDKKEQEYTLAGIDPRNYMKLEVRASFKEKLCTVKFDYNIPEGKTADDMGIDYADEKLFPNSVKVTFGEDASQYLSKKGTGLPFAAGRWPESSGDGKTPDGTYTFGGWWGSAVNEETGETYTFNMSEAEVQIKEDITVQAKWIANTGTIELYQAYYNYESADQKPRHRTIGCRDENAYPVAVRSTATITFEVRNGAWNDRTTDPITVEVTLTDGKGTLKKDAVPKARLRPAEGFAKKGVWNVNPNPDEETAEGIDVGGDATFVYSYIPKDEQSPEETRAATITFRVTNGTWEDDGTEDRIVSVPLPLDKKKKFFCGTLKEENVPLGMKPADGYDEGAIWNVKPATGEKAVTGDMTYVCTFLKTPTLGADVKWAPQWKPDEEKYEKMTEDELLAEWERRKPDSGEENPGPGEENPGQGDEHEEPAPGKKELINLLIELDWRDHDLENQKQIEREGKIKALAANEADKVYTPDPRDPTVEHYGIELVGKTKGTPGEVEVKTGDIITLTYETGKYENRFTFFGWFRILVNKDGEVTDETALRKVTDCDPETEGCQIVMPEGTLALVAIWDYSPIRLYLRVEDLEGHEVKDGTGRPYKGFGSIAVPYRRPSGIRRPDEFPAIRETVSTDWRFDCWKNTKGQKITDDEEKKILGNDQNCGKSEDIVWTSKWKKVDYFNHSDFDEEGVKYAAIDGFSADGREKCEENTEWVIPRVVVQDVNGVDVELEVRKIARGKDKDGEEKGAFEGEKISKITIKGNIRRIERGAFKDCENLTEVVFEGEFKGLTIEEGAFENCTRLERIVFPDNVRKGNDEELYSIYPGVLRGCRSVRELTYPGNIPVGSLFCDEAPSGSGWEALEQGGVKYWIPGTLKNVTISNTEEELCAYAFQNTKSINQVVLSKPVEGKPDKPYIKRIGREAFSESNIHDGLSLENVEEIGFYAFSGCDNLPAINLEKIRKIKDGAFMDCVGTGVSADIGFTTITLGENLKAIPDRCFKDCTRLKTVNMNKVMDIGSSAFEGCEALDTLVLEDEGNWIERINPRAFKGCVKLADYIEELNNVRYVGREAFAGTAWFKADSNRDKVLCVGKVIYYDNNASVGPDLFPSGTSKDVYEKYISIASGAFEGKNLPNTLNLCKLSRLRKIEDGAFEGCTDLKKINLPESIVEIGVDAFRDSSVETLDLYYAESGDFYVQAPQFFTQSVDADGNASYAEFCSAAGDASVAFEEVPALYTKDNESYVLFEGNLYADATGAALSLPVASGTKLYVKKDKMQRNCLDLARIGRRAFKDCTSLKSVNFPVIPGEDISADKRNNLRNAVRLSIGEDVFAGCSSLEEITLPDNLGGLGARVFENCAVLKTVRFIDTAKYDDESCYLGLIAEIPEGAFRGCSTLGSDTTEDEVKIPKFTTKIGTEAYYGCWKISKFGNGEATGLKVGDRAFMNATSLVTAHVGGIDKLGVSAFENCSLLRSVKGLPRIIPDRAFYDCSALTDPVFPSSIEVGESAFNRCTGLERLMDGNGYPVTIAEVGDFAFWHCERLAAARVSAKTIGEQAFSGTDIAEAKLSGVEKIGPGAFSGCKSLETVDFGSGLDEIDLRAFAECSRLESVELPDKIGFVRAEAFQGCGKLVEVIFGTGIETIERGAFSDCAAGSSLKLVVTFKGILTPRIGGSRDADGDLFEGVADYEIRVRTGYMESFVNDPKWESYKDKIVEDPQL